MAVIIKVNHKSGLVAISDDDKKKDSVVLNLNAEKFKAGDALLRSAMKGENVFFDGLTLLKTRDHL